MAATVGFYGVGSRAQPYLKALAQRPDVRLTAVCDPDPRTAEQVAAGWGAQVFANCETLLREARPELLWICVPAHLQTQVLLKVAEARIPFFVEPPGAVDFATARACAAQVKATGVVSAVGFTGHYADVAKEAREYLGVNPVPVALGWWLRQPEEQETATAQQLLWNDACRYVDMLRLFCGDVKQVHALGAGLDRAEGGLIVQLEFAGGDVGVLTCATFARPEARLELELMGEGWTLTFEGGLSLLRLAERDKTTILRRLNDPAEAHVEAFLAAAAAGDPSRVAASYPDSLGTLAVCQAACLSIREARAVNLAELS
jgi:myo-inositol 2-dehydrogenase / D-chiro-inositol 1-dehydrogenase